MTTRKIFLRMLDLYVFAGIEYRLHKKNDLGAEFIRLDVTNVKVFLTYAEITEQMQSPEWDHFPDYFAPEREELRASGRDVELFLASEYSRETGLWYQSLCRLFMVEYDAGFAKITDPSIKETLLRVEKPALLEMRDKIPEVRKKRSGARKPEKRQDKSSAELNPWDFELPGPRRFRDLLAAYRANNGSAKAIRPRTDNCGNRTLRFPTETYQFMNQMIMKHLTEKRPVPFKVADLVLDEFAFENDRRTEVSERQMVVPSRGTIVKYVKKISPYQRSVRTLGAEEANKKHLLQEDGVDALYPLQRVVIDDCDLDVFTLAAKTNLANVFTKEQLAKLPRHRLILTLAIDSATRVVLGIKVSSKPGVANSLAVLDQIIRDKTEFAQSYGAESTWKFYGRPGLIVCDNGAPFVAASFRRAVEDLRSNLRVEVGGLAHFKTHVERIFRSLGTGLMPLFSARTHSNVVEKGKSDPKSEAVLTDDELTAALAIFIVDVYHNSRHRGLNDATPANPWRRLCEQYGDPVKVPSRVRAAAVGVAIKRRAHNGITTFAALDYRCDKLKEVCLDNENTEVDVRVDPANLGTVTIWYHGKPYLASCATAGFDDVRYEDWKREFTEIVQSNRAESELSLPVVRRGIKKIREMDDFGRKRGGFGVHEVTAEDFEYDQKSLFYGFSIQRGDQETPTGPTEGGFLSDVIEPTPLTMSDSDPSDIESEIPGGPNATQNPKSGWEISDE